MFLLKKNESFLLYPKIGKQKDPFRIGLQWMESWCLLTMLAIDYFEAVYFIGQKKERS